MVTLKYVSFQGDQKIVLALKELKKLFQHQGIVKF